MNTKKQRLRDACQRGNFKVLLHRARSTRSNKPLEELFEPDLSQPLHYAAARGNLEVVRELIETYECDPMCENMHGITPLHCASYCGQIYVVKYLQELYGTDTIVVDWLGACPIVYSTYCTISRELHAPLDYFWHTVVPSNGHIETAKYLLSLRIQNGQNCALSPKLVRVLRLPVCCGSLADLECVIEALTQLEFQADSVEYNNEVYECLSSAIYSNKWDFVKALLLAFLDPIKAAARLADTEGSSSQSFIRTLFERADVDLIKQFLELEICKLDLLTLKWAIDRNCYELVKYLLESADNLSVMERPRHDDRYNHSMANKCSSLLSYVFSSESCEQRLVKLIADYGTDGRDVKGNTVLHLACKYSIMFIIEDNSYHHNNTSLNNKGQMPLHIACAHGNLEIIKIITSSQPRLDINLQDSDGNTPLHIACQCEWKGTDVLPCFKYLLLERKCNVNIQNNLKELPFHILLKNNNVTTDMRESILAMCSKSDININAQDGKGMTLLHVACNDGSLSMVCYLTSNFQCDVNLSDNEGNLPLHYAVKSQGRGYYSLEDMSTSLEMAQLVSKGCTQIHAKNNSGITPLHTACSDCNMDLVKYLAFHKQYPLNLSPASDVYDNLDIHLACQKEEDIALLKVLANQQNINRLGRLINDSYEGYERYSGTPLHIACAYNFIPAVRYSSTPLHIACTYNNIPAVRLFGELNCNFSIKDSQGLLPLHIVCSKSRSLQCVKLLKIHADDLKVVDEWKGNTPLHLACKHNCADIVKYLLAMYRCDLNIKNRSGELPLHLACSTTVEIVKRVSKCNTNSQTASGDTPLHIACKAGALDIVKYLVRKCRRSMTLKNNSERLPVHYACEHSLEMVKLVAQSCTTEDLITKTFGYMSALNIACSHGFIDMATYLINQKGCSLSALKGDQSALQYASGIPKYGSFFHDHDEQKENFHPELVEYLIAECGYDPCMSTESGYSTASMFCYACRQKNLQLVKALTVLSVNIKDSEGNTPLHYACEYSCVEIAQFLIDHRCDQTILNNKGELALHLACRKSLTITQMLTNCDVNTLNFNGNAPIHIACSNYWNGDDIPVYLIEEAKCDVNIPDKGGRYALHMACLRSLRTIKLLLQKCDVNCEDPDGNTALNIVCSGGKCESIAYLLKNKLCRADIPNKSGDLPLHHFVNYDGPAQTSELQSLTELLVDRHVEAIRMANYEGCTPVQIAVIKGKLNFLQLLHQRNELDFTTASNKTLLHIACKYRHVHMVRWMLDHGADSSIPDEEGNYPEHLCIDDNNPELKLTVEKQYKEAERKRHWKIFTSEKEIAESDNLEKIPKHLYIGENNPSLKTLTELGVLHVYNRSKDGNTVLHIACQDDRDHILQHVLSASECTDALSISNNDGDTPLHILATRKVTLSNIIPLIKCNDPDVKNKLGNTPLHVACQNNNIEFATLLLADLQCNTNIKNDQGEIPLHLAVSKSLELVKLVVTSETVNVQRNDGDTPLHIACRHEQLSVILHLIDDLKCSVQILNNNDDSPFHILLSKSWSQTGSLLKYIPSSESNRKNKNGDTLLHVACRYSTVSTVSFLTKSLNFRTDTLNESGVAPLHFACRRGFINMVRPVSNCNPQAQVNDVSMLTDVKFVHGDTPLHVACRNGKANIVKYLLRNEHTKALHICNQRDELPLHLACQHGDNMIRPFVRFATIFNCSAGNSSGDTPLHIACRNKSTAAIINLLVNEMSCKTNAVNKDGDLPLHIACRSRETFQKLVNILCTGLHQEELILQNVNGNTALHELLQRTYEKREAYTMESILTNRDKQSSWIQRLKETIICIVQRMPKIDILNKQDEQPIHLACQYQTLQVVEFLCEQYRGFSKRLPEDTLHKACLNKYPSVLEYLIKNFELDHAINVPDKNGDLPLHIATKRRCAKSVDLLIKKTVNVNYTNHQGNTPVHELFCNSSNYVPSSASTNSTTALNILMENNVSLSTRNLKGQTPLHCMATRYSDLETVTSKKKIDVNVQDNEDRTLLHIACQANQLKCVELLLSAGADVSIKDKQGQTAITLTKEPEIIKMLTEYGADPQPIYDMHRKFFETFSSEAPPSTPAKLLVIGDPSVGKTTLVQSLRNEGSEGVILANKFDHTTGIVTTTFSSKIYGDVKFFDFAGQPEYYASHDGFLHSILKNVPPTVLILVNLTESKKKIQNRVHYWINFIENRCATFNDATHIIIVCSHADVLVSKGDDPLEKVSKLHQSITSEFEDKKLVLKDFLHINCTLSISEEMVRLQQALKDSTNELREEGVMHFNSHCFYVLLLQTFKDCKVITLGHIISKLKLMSKDSDTSPLFLVHSDRNAVIQMSKELDDKGHIMFIEHPFVIDKSWLILDNQPLLHDLLGTLFAPSSFPQHRPLSYSTGVVPLSLFKKYFGEQDSYTANMLLTFLTRLEYCREIMDKVLLDSIVKQEGYLQTEKYFFFPNLVSLTRPDDKWSTGSRYSYQCGWLVQCKKDGDFFSPHFIQALLLRLTFAFAPKNASYDSRDIEDSEDESDEDENQAMALVIKRTCSVWKNGLYWQERSGVKTIVDIIDQRTLVLVMQCRRGSEMQLLTRRSTIMSMVLDAKKEFCSKSKVIEYFLHPQCVKHPLKNISKCRLFSLPQIELCIVHREPYVINDHNDEVDLKELLLFEPYFELSTDIIRKLSNEASFHKQVNDDLLSSIAGQLCHRYQLFICMLGMEATDKTRKLAYILKQIIKKPNGATYRDLNELFNQMSIFCGRQPPQGMQHLVLYFTCYTLKFVTYSFS